MPVNPPAPKPPPDLPTLLREAEERRLQDAIRLRRWRQRRLTYGLLAVGVGLSVPIASLAFAGSISADGFWVWIKQAGWMPLVFTAIGSVGASLLIFLRGWGVSLGMISFGVLFMALVAFTRAVIGGLLPAMPGLVAIFVAAGALVGYLTVLEDDQ